MTRKFLPVSNNSNVSSIKYLHGFRKQYPKNKAVSYLNLNSIRKTLNDLKSLTSDSPDVLCIVESKLEESFLNGEIALEGFKKPYRLDVTASSDGLLICVKVSLLSNIINYYDFKL